MAKKKSKSNWWCCGPACWGWFFIILGIYYFAKNMGWIMMGFPVWPVVLVIIGICLLNRARKNS